MSEVDEAFQNCGTHGATTNTETKNRFKKW